ncbi:MAG: HD domain-containing protein [Rikenellaceae bacterium]|nr:HD domain-containing protein [Rikenellaceae bacterium]
MTMNSKLTEYIEREIIPLYSSFDKAHQTDHAREVISRSLELATHYDVDINMVYTVAAYHDTGLSEGRERHHIVSGEILEADLELRKYFTAEQIAVMREAVEDHRASSDHEPRTIYGRIVAEADRLIVPQTIIRRTVQFGLAHYPELTREEHFIRCKEHLVDKYGENGYLKLWIPHSQNAVRLAELRKIIANPTLLRELFEAIFAEELN